MNKVYVVTFDIDYEYKNDQVVGVFSSRKNALNAIQKLSDEIGHSFVEFNDFEIKEFKVNDFSMLLQKQVGV